MMPFDRFIRDVDEAVRLAVPGGAGVVATRATASWTGAERHVDVALVAPQNVSVSLKRGGQPADTTWYPIDPALVPVVSRRIAGFLNEAR